MEMSSTDIVAQEDSSLTYDYSPLKAGLIDFWPFGGSRIRKHNIDMLIPYKAVVV